MPYGNFYVGKGGFSYKKSGGGGVRRNAQIGLITNQPADINNRYVAGSGVGARTISNRRNLAKRAATCGINCFRSPLVVQSFQEPIKDDIYYENLFQEQYRIFLERFNYYNSIY